MYITVLQTLIAYFVVRGFSSSICLSICLCFYNKCRYIEQLSYIESLILYTVPRQELAES